MNDLAREYLFFVFLAALGVLQVAAAYGGVTGLLLLRSRRAVGLLGLSLALASFVWFFARGNRNLPDTNGGIAGAQQFGYFVVGCAAAVTVTYLLSSLLNASRSRPPVHPAEGLEALAGSTVLQALGRNLAWGRKRWLTWMRKSSSG